MTAINGEKAVWMTPQNSEGVSRNRLDSNLNYETVPYGYSVDDDASYWGTYKQEDVYPNFALAHNDGFVGMPACATIESEDGIEKAMTVASASLINVGCACVFKPLPDGPLIPGKFISQTEIACFWNENEIGLYKNGIVVLTT